MASTFCYTPPSSEYAKSIHPYFKSHGLPAQRLNEIVDVINFEPWPQFATLAQKASNQSTALQGHDILTKRTDDWEEHAPVVLDLISQFVAHSDSEIAHVRTLAAQAATTYGPKGGSHRVLHNIGIFTASEKLPPDAGVRVPVHSEAEEVLLPAEGALTAVATSYNRHFRTCRQRNNTGELSDDWLLNIIAETVFAALHTRSGWYSLYTCNEALFLQVDANQSCKSRWLTVRVSDIYKSDGAVSPVNGLLALFQASKVASDRKLEELGDLATRLMRCTARKLSGHSKGGTESNGKKTYADSTSTDDLALTSLERVELQRAIRGETLLILNERDITRFFLMNCRGSLGWGSSGYVVISRVEGVDVAVKRWNAFTADAMDLTQGELDLKHEIQVYKYLYKHYPQLFGRVLPRLIAVSRDNADECVLVTQLVGHDIEITKEPLNGVDSGMREVWSVEGERLSEQDRTEIEHCKNEMWQELEGLGLHSDDVVTPNMRVEKMRSGKSDRKWRAWIIDLGLCSVLWDGQVLLKRS